MEQLIGNQRVEVKKPKIWVIIILLLIYTVIVAALTIWFGSKLLGINLLPEKRVTPVRQQKDDSWRNITSDFCGLSTKIPFKIEPIYNPNGQTLSVEEVKQKEVGYIWYFNEMENSNQPFNKLFVINYVNPNPTDDDENIESFLNIHCAENSNFTTTDELMKIIEDKYIDIQNEGIFPNPPQIVEKINTDLAGQSSYKVKTKIGNSKLLDSYVLATPKYIYEIELINNSKLPKTAEIFEEIINSIQFN